MRRFHWSVYASAAVGAVAAFLVIGPVAAAVVMLRCCSDSSGPTLAAWAVLAGILAVAVLVAALLAGLLAWLVGSLVRRAA